MTSDSHINVLSWYRDFPLATDEVSGAEQTELELVPGETHLYYERGTLGADGAAGPGWCRRSLYETARKACTMMSTHAVESKIASVRCTVDVTLPAERAFSLFTEHFALWWSREYTWGQDVLEDIGLEPKPGGLCYERGPHGFRSDVLAWHISPRREPELNPAKASTIEVTFVAATPAQTRIDFEHRDFERHGAGADQYRESLASSKGWPWILDRYRAASSIGKNFTNTR